MYVLYVKRYKNRCVNDKITNVLLLTESCLVALTARPETNNTLHAFAHARVKFVFL